jgi:hypothetical protein
MEASLCVRNVRNDNVTNAANTGGGVPTMTCRHLGADYSTIFQKSPVAMVRTRDISQVSAPTMHCRRRLTISLLRM